MTSANPSGTWQYGRGSVISPDFVVKNGVHCRVDPHHSPSCALEVIIPAWRARECRSVGRRGKALNNWRREGRRVDRGHRGTSLMSYAAMKDLACHPHHFRRSSITRGRAKVTRRPGSIVFLHAPHGTIDSTDLPGAKYAECGRYSTRANIPELLQEANGILTRYQVEET